MSLNDRKIQILQAIINDYIETAEPVGSRTIAKKYNLGISSATIRNEMSDLEEMGFIIQPHASSGRIPSDLGYRLYVDHLMQKKELSPEEEQYLQNVVNRNVGQIDYLLEEMAKALSLLTNYTTIISEPVSQTTRIKQIRLLPLDEGSILLVIATEDNFIKNHVIKMGSVPNEEVILRMGMYLNHVLQGYTIADIDANVVRRLQRELAEYSGILPHILKAIEKTMRAAEKVHLHMSGTNNILACPEFSDIQKAKSLFQTLEEKDVLVTLLESGKSDDMQILIGSENQVQSMKDCSVITATYKMGDNTRGTIGIVGPTRMDYSQVVSVLNGMVSNIEKVLKNLADGNKKT
ncbi:heat-inducible transcription repressor HrcA [Anaerotignum lactatifermentans]|uniref:Heat-inducible transcription repressor HrcA n=1 Tax=Anaerotignum lactatifermentans TaxID=160404 RepID=A0ABS2G6U1_9FIRM|nr:heat-inducible transcriptional repressor HrcA [Anaerotignum lactatifermentans]MBM6829743.1 heat-inducible transcription repressor HrcA [Anaerotignum lactatifermentans]MBM6877164.1 heat-inducible transcription repressor HrcA [Anaerotignum lactatifermentans]MBM6951402.1 heat-inducible transcription repressor HrcA [Anaerotignum lactatifermentans]